MSDIDDMEAELLGALGSDDEKEEQQPTTEKAGEEGDAEEDAAADDEEDEEEDDEEEESEEEEDDDEPASKRRRKEDGEEKGKKKRKKRGANRFLDDAAGGSSDEDEDDMAPLREEEDDMDESYLENYQKKDEGLMRENETEEEAAARIEREAAERKAQEKEEHERLKRVGGAGFQLTEAAGGSGRFQADLLPKQSDPKVFAVKVKPQCAKQTVARLVNKCYAYRVGKNHEKKKIDLGIISAFALDNVKEWFYVEASRQQFVENAVNGLENVFRHKIVPIDRSELMQLIMNTGKPKEMPKVRSLARLRMHPYKGDLCEIVKVMEGGTRVKVRCVPRVEFVGKQYVKVARKNQQVFPQKFFIPQYAIGCRNIATYNNEFEAYQWGDLKFDQEGYLILDISARAIMFGSKFEKPPVEEVAFFMKEEKSRIAAAIGMSDLTDNRVEFSLNDEARVFRGQLEGAVGKIVDVSPKDGIATLRWQMRGQKGAMDSRVELIDCTKWFPESSHIEVTRGPREGQSGLVLAMEGESVFFLNDATKREDQARANDCKKSSIRQKQLHNQGAWQLYDLVQLNDQTVGIITEFGTNGFTVLSHNGHSKVVPVNAVKQSMRNQTPNALDFFGNLLAPRKAVTLTSQVKQRTLHNRTGNILQIYNNTVFVRVDIAGKASSILALEAKQVALRGGINKIGGQKAPRREPHIPDRPVYTAAAPKGPVSQTFTASSLPWQNTERYNPTQ